MTTTINNEHKKLNVPNLRFKEFEGEWSVTTLQKDCIVNPTNEKIADKFVYVDLESVKQGQLYKYQILTKDNAPSRAQRVLHTDDILFQCVRPYQMNNYMVKGTMSDIQWVASTGYAQIRTQTDYPAFLYYVLNTSKYNKAVMVRCTGSSYPAINSEDLSKIPFYKCGIAEQKKIADFLSLLDERIATQNKVIEDLKKLKSAIIEKHYSQVKKQTTCIADLGEPFSVGSLAKDDLAEIGSPCVIYGELFTTYGEIIFHIESYTNKTDGMILSKKGDLLFPSSTTVDAMSLIAPSVINVDGVILGGDMFGIHISHNYNAQYLSYYFNHIAKKQLAKFAKGSTIIHLHYTDIEKAKLLLPSLEEQNRMAKYLVALDKKVSVEQNLLSSLTCQKSFLLQQMFI